MNVLKRRKGRSLQEESVLPQTSIIASASSSLGPSRICSWFYRYPLLLRVVVLLSLGLLYYDHTTTTTTSTTTFTLHDHLAHIPPQCHDLATTFWDIQMTSTKFPLVLTCHRIWCHSVWGGYCDPCAGIGDRTKSLLSIVQYATMVHQQPILLDYPNDFLDIPPALVYQEEEAFWRDLFHSRSYNVQNRITNPNQWGTTMQYAHFFATYPQPPTNFDPCWFWILFQPSKQLTLQLQQYPSQFSVGIHFRTGDGVAFGITNQDVRVVVDLETALDKLLSCALQKNQTATVFLATDNAHVKQLAHLKYPTTIVTTTTMPSSYLQSDEEMGVWLDWFLLMKCDTIVVNKLQHGYNGTAFALSTMATMVQKIKPLQPDQLIQCDLE